MSPEVAQNAVWTLIGLVTGLGGALFVTAKDLSYVKGQLNELVGMVQEFKKLAGDFAVLDRSHLKTQIDVKSAHEKIRTLQQDLKEMMS